ncbi:MAG TPA: rRNA maturation RNase YbeY [Bacteroidetes bacterium]|nr:rRNA maturation RNase YbeY [Bacteroidota bacterium]
MIISAHSESGEVPLSERELKKIVREILQQENLELDGEIRFIFTDDEYIRQLNREFLKHDYATDVISFPLEADDDYLDGEIYISRERAEEQAKERGLPVQEELWRLVIHGLLHLLGYDDLSEEKRREMFSVQESYLEKFGLKGKEQ